MRWIIENISHVTLGSLSNRLFGGFCEWLSTHSKSYRTIRVFYIDFYGATCVMKHHWVKIQHEDRYYFLLKSSIVSSKKKKTKSLGVYYAIWKGGKYHRNNEQTFGRYRKQRKGSFLHHGYLKRYLHFQSVPVKKLDIPGQVWTFLKVVLK